MYFIFKFPLQFLSVLEVISKVKFQCKVFNGIVFLLNAVVKKCGWQEFLEDGWSYFLAYFLAPFYNYCKSLKGSFFIQFIWCRVLCIFIPFIVTKSYDVFLLESITKNMKWNVLPCRSRNFNIYIHSIFLFVFFLLFLVVCEFTIIMLSW